MTRRMDLIVEIRRNARMMRSERRTAKPPVADVKAIATMPKSKELPAVAPERPAERQDAQGDLDREDPQDDRVNKPDSVADPSHDGRARLKSQDDGIDNDQRDNRAFPEQALEEGAQRRHSVVPLRPARVPLPRLGNH